jgi:N-acetyl-anhydromuramyl-L-alanine amidase AmpD
MAIQKLVKEAVKYIVVHCSATPEHMDIGAEEISRWHRGKGWVTIGYHFVIRRDGELEHGRSIDSVGAHVQGRNKESVGVCLVGGTDIDFQPENNFTDPQFETLKEILRELIAEFPNAKIVGHHELDAWKDCPSFDVQKWLKENEEEIYS